MQAIYIELIKPVGVAQSIRLSVTGLYGCVFKPQHCRVAVVSSSEQDVQLTSAQFYPTSLVSYFFFFVLCDQIVTLPIHVTTFCTYKYANFINKLSAIINNLGVVFVVLFFHIKMFYLAKKKQNKNKKKQRHIALHIHDANNPQSTEAFQQ